MTLLRYETQRRLVDCNPRPQRRRVVMQRLAGKKILMVDDEPDVIGTWKTIFENAKVHFEGASTIPTAIRAAKATPFDAIMLDLGLPGSKGVETLLKMRVALPDVPIVVTTGTDDPKTVAECFAAGAQDYLVKGKADPDLVLRSLLVAIGAAQRGAVIEAIRGEITTLRAANQTTAVELRQSIEKLELILLRIEGRGEDAGQNSTPDESAPLHPV